MQIYQQNINRCYLNCIRCRKSHEFKHRISLQNAVWKKLEQLFNPAFKCSKFFLTPTKFACTISGKRSTKNALLGFFAMLLRSNNDLKLQCFSLCAPLFPFFWHQCSSGYTVRSAPYSRLKECNNSNKTHQKKPPKSNLFSNGSHELPFQFPSKCLFLSVLETQFIRFR